MYSVSFPLSIPPSIRFRSCTQFLAPLSERRGLSRRNLQGDTVLIGYPESTYSLPFIGYLLSHNSLSPWPDNLYFVFAQYAGDVGILT